MINDGIVIKTTEEFGRAAYVIRHFRAGEVVLNELPLFEADTGFHPLLAELTKLCNKQWIVRNAGVDAGRVDGQLAVWTFELCKAPKEVRDKLVREMYVPQWETMHDSTCVELAENVADTLKLAANTSKKFRVCKQFSKEQLTRFTLIASINAHAFRKSSSAIFELQSKIAHECGRPNTAYTSPSSDADGPARGISTALRDIAPGEMLTSNYIDCEMVAQPARWCTLYHEKGFSCRCRRCMREWDLARGLPCPRCSKLRDDHGLLPIRVALGDEPIGIIYCDMGKKVAGNDRPWRCDKCHDTFPDDSSLLLGNLADVECVEHKVEGFVMQSQEDLQAMDTNGIADITKRFGAVAAILGPAHGATHRMLLLHMEALSEEFGQACITSTKYSLEKLEAYLEELEDDARLVWNFVYSRLKTNPEDILGHMFTQCARNLAILAIVLTGRPNASNLALHCATVAYHLLQQVRPAVDKRRNWDFPHPATSEMDKALARTMHLMKTLGPLPTDAFDHDSDEVVREYSEEEILDDEVDGDDADCHEEEDDTHYGTPLSVRPSSRADADYETRAPDIGLSDQMANLSLIDDSANGSREQEVSPSSTPFVHFWREEEESRLKTFLPEHLVAGSRKSKARTKKGKKHGKGGK